MLLPVAFPAEAAAVNGLLETLADLDRQTTISAREVMQQPEGEKAYGLAPARGVIVIQSPDRRLEILIGNKVLSGEQVYLKVLGDSGVEVVDAVLTRRLPARADEWRSRMLASIGGQSFDRVSARGLVSFYELQADLTNRVWRLTQPLPARANSVEVELALRQLNNARIQGFVNDLPNPDLDPYGLATPQLRLALSRGTNEIWNLAFGAATTNYPDLLFARLPAGNIVVVDKAVAEAFRPQPTVTKFRETRLVDFPTNQVDRIEIRAKESFLLQRQTNDAWHMTQPLDFPVDTFNLARFLYTMNHLEVTEFVHDVVTDFTPFGFTTNSRQYTVLATRTNATGGLTNTVLAQIQLGSNANGRVMARRTDENSVYALNELDTVQLPEWSFELRDRHIWNFATNQVVGLTISWHGQTRSITRDATGKWLLPRSSTIMGPLVDEVVYRLSQLKTDWWTARGVDSLPLLGFDKAAHQLTVDVKIGDTVESRVLQFGGATPRQSTPYAAVMLDGQPTVFVLASEIYNPYEILLGGLNLPAGDGAR